MRERPVVIDLSNICCDRRLDDTGDLARWDRYERLLGQLEGHLGYVPELLALADASLERKLAPEDRREMRSAIADGEVRVAPGDADADVLHEARARGAAVVSNDRFVDYRREQPWIDDNSDDFLGWIPDRGAGLRVVEREMGRHTGFSISRAAEKGMLKERGLLRRRDGREWIVTEVLEHRYQCVNDTCLAARLAPDDIGVPRREPDGRVVCPSCSQPVLENGPRPSGIQLKLIAGDTEQRIAIYEGQTLILGRGKTSPHGADPSLLLADELRARVSREHAAIELTDDGLVATDLSGVASTAVRRWSPDQRRHLEPQEIPSGGSVPIGRRDQLVLADLVVIEPSGQRFGAR